MKNSERDSGLDVLRFIAIAWVLGLHSLQVASFGWPVLGRFLAMGWVGVDLFFVLSGFLIGAQAMADARETRGSTALGEFWIKRWMRTVPLYLVVLATYVIVKPHAMGAPFRPTLWPFFIFGQNYGDLSDFVQSWSLCIEEQFYLVLPLLVLALPRLVRRPEFWAACFILGPVARTATLFGSGSAAEWSAATFDRLFRFPTYTHLDGIIVGVFLAATEKRWSPWIRVRPLFKVSALAIGALSIVGILLVTTAEAELPDRSTMPWLFSVLAIAFGLVLVGARNTAMRPGITRSLIEWGATLSYGAYLWNNLWIRVVAKFALGVWSVPVFLLGTILTAGVTYFIVERPFLRVRSAVLRRWRRRAVAFAPPELPSESRAS